MADTSEHPHDQPADQELGFSVLELADLPPMLLKVARLVLRHGPISYAELCQAAAALPDAEQPSLPELDESLASLCAQGWIVRVDGHESGYKINLRHRARGALAEREPRSRAARALSQKIWTALDTESDS
jgi:hypothetical protein